MVVDVGAGTLKRSVRWALCLTCAVLAFAVAWSSLGKESLWIDEVISLEQALTPFGDAIHRMVFADVHPPGFRVMLGLWAGCTGFEALSLRCFSLLLGFMVVYVVARWSRPLALIPVGGLFLAMHAGIAHYSQELRVYIFMALWILGVVGAARAQLRRPGLGSCAALGALFALGAWCHYAAWIFVAGTVVGLTAVFAMDRNRLAWLGCSAALAVALFAPWIPVFLHQLLGLPEGFFAHLRRAPSLVAFSRTLGPWGGLAEGWMGVVGAGLMLILVGFGIYSVFVNPDEEQLASASDSPAPPRRLLWILALVSALAVLPAPFLLPRTPLQEALLGKMILPSLVAAVGLTAVFGAAPRLIFFLLHRLFCCCRVPLHASVEGEGESLRGPTVPQVAAAIFLGSFGVGLCAVATGRLGVPRSILPLVPLMALLVLPSPAKPAGGQRWSLALAMIIFLPMPLSALNQTAFVQPRPVYAEALELARSEGAEGVVVQSPFDAPALRHAAWGMGLPETFVKSASQPLIMLPGHALMLTRSWCDEARGNRLRLFNGRAQSLRILKLQELRAICVVSPGDFEVSEP